MAAAVEDNFLLQHALDRVESVRRFLNRPRGSEPAGPTVEGMISVALGLPDLLRKAWQATLEQLFLAGEEYGRVSDLEETRKAVRRAFYEAGEMMEAVIDAAERWQKHTDKTTPGFDQLVPALVQLRRMEEDVFRDWPSFTDPLPPETGEALPVEEAFAQMRGLTVERLRQKVEAHKRRYHSGDAERP